MTVSLLLLAVAGLAGPLWLLEVRLGRRAAVATTAGLTAAAAVAVALGAGVLWPLALALLFSGAAYGLGGRLATWLGLDDDVGRWRGVAFRLALGWAGVVVIGLAAGTAGVLTAPVVGATVVTGIALAARSAASRSPAPADPASERTFAARESGGPPAAGWWGLAVLCLAVLVSAAAPDVRHDALAAHLPIAREFAARGAIVVMPENAASYFQLNADLLYAMAMLATPGADLPQFLHLGAGIAAALLVYDLGARLWSPPTGLAAAAVVAGTPLVWWVGGTAYTDLWVMLFVVGALAAADLYRRQPGTGRAASAGLLAGAAVGVKMTAAALIVPLAGALLLWIVRSEAGRARWRSLGALATGFAAAGAYWYARAGLLRSNPLHPLFPELFGLPPRPLHVRTFGTGHGVLDLLALPWNVTVHPERFVEIGPIGAVYLLLLPVALIAVARRMVPGWLALVFTAAGLIWFSTAQYLRYFLPALPLAALMGAGGVFALRGRVRVAAAAILVVALAAVSCTWATGSGWYFALRVAARHLDREGYAAIYVPGYRVARFAARTLRGDARILGAGEELSYYYERFFVPTSWRGQSYALRGLRILELQTGAEVEVELRRVGFTHLAAAPAAREVGRGLVGSWILREAFWEEGPRLIHADGGRYLFEVSSPSGPRVPGPPLLPERQDETPGMTSTVSVAPGTLYALEAEVRTGVADAPAELRIQWLDRAGRPLMATPHRRVAAGDQWRRVAMAATAPDGAGAAMVAVQAAGTERVDVQGVKFYELR